MKVLLIAPTHNYKSYPSPLSISDFPSGIAYIAASLNKAGHEVYGLNPNNIFGYSSGRAMLESVIPDAIEQSQPDWIGLTGICIDYAFLKDAIGIIREATDKPIILGGGIVSNDPEFIMEDLKPDYQVIGDGEDVILDIVNIRPHKRGELAVRTFWGQHSKQDLIPDYDSFGAKEMIEGFSHYTRVLYRYSRPNPRPMIIITARGCPYACTFCVNHHGKYYPRTIKSIMNELALSYDKYKFNVLIVQDELFAINKQRMVDFCNAVIEYKERTGSDFDWMMQTHANSRLDLETLKLAKKSGLYLFSYGVESASPTVIKSMKKHIKPEQIAEAIELASEVGIGFAGNLIFGDPAETEDTIRETLDFYFKHGIDCEMFLGIVQPYPGSEIFPKNINKQYYYDHIGEYVYNLTKMPDKLFSRWMNFLTSIESSYMLIKSANAHEVSSNMVKVNCPHCGEESHYTEDATKIDLMVMGCQHCHKRMRINI